MTRKQLLLLFPNASNEFIAQNTTDGKATRIVEKNEAPTVKEKIMELALKSEGEIRGLSPSRSGMVIDEMCIMPSTFTFTLTGQIMGGKNNIVITRAGHRFPKKSWADWRDSKIEEVKSQTPTDWVSINRPTDVILKYVSGDKRRRDMPAIIDSIWHILEKAGIVEDDTYLWVSESSRSYDKENPRAEITFSR